MEDTQIFNDITKKLRKFFQEEKGFVEVPTQSRLSILAACEDPKTITQFEFDGTGYPLPQTGQMWLEYEILKNPKFKGVFCQTTSYRNEPFPIAGRHKKIFPMFEFESHGGFDELKKIEFELLEFLGFSSPTSFEYEKLCKLYSTDEIKAEHEERICNEINPVICLEKFPGRTNPFWNMKHNKNNIYNKIDIILYGQETIGSAERSTNIQEMRENFYSISDGMYANLLFTKFGKDRVEKELEEYFSLPMIPRFGAGVGVTRLARAMQCAGLIEANNEAFFKPNFASTSGINIQI